MIHQMRVINGFDFFILTSMNEFLSSIYCGNTISQWLLAAVYLLGSIFVAKFFYWFISKFVKRLAEKTTTNLDDILIDMFEEPFVFGIVLVGGYLALSKLSLESGADNWISKIFTVLVTINVTWFIARTIIALMDNYLHPKMQEAEGEKDKYVFPIVRRLINIVVWGIGIVTALNNAGYDITAMIAGLGIGGLALAMAAQDSVSNFFGGFTIFTDHPFTVGERICINGFDGIVSEIGMRSFRLRTLNGTEVVIPNSQVTSSIIENISRAPSKKIKLELGLTYDTTPEKIEEAKLILQETAKNHKDIDDNYATYFMSFGDFSLGILFVYYISKGADVFQVQSEVNMSILRKFNEANLNFAFPSQTIYTAK